MNTFYLLSHIYLLPLLLHQLIIDFLELEPIILNLLLEILIHLINLLELYLHVNELDFLVLSFPESRIVFHLQLRLLS